MDEEGYNSSMSTTATPIWGNLKRRRSELHRSEGSQRERETTPNVYTDNILPTVQSFVTLQQLVMSRICCLPTTVTNLPTTYLICPLARIFRKQMHHF